MSLGFTGGLLVIVAALSLVFVWLQLGLMEWMGYAMPVIDVAGAGFMIFIGASYFVGRSFRIPLPTINPPASLRGYRAAPVYGILLGGPGAAHCTTMLVIPIIILGLASLQPLAVVYALAAYVLGRAIPIVIIGTMMQDAQLRFVQMLAGRSTLVNRVIGVAVILSGISLFFIT
jgi:cytochrome c biogenesis protein CcdA